MLRLARPLALVLLAGVALLGAGAVMHPMLEGTAEAQLRLIAGTAWWRELHLAMLAGSGLVMLGMWVRGVVYRGPDHPPLVAVLVVLTVGYALNALNIAFMAGAGTHMATQFAAGRAEMASIFDATHPIGQMSARFGNLLVALGALLLGWVERRDAASSRWAAPLAWLAAAAGLVGALAIHESSKLALAGVATLSGWQVLTAIRAFGVTPHDEHE